ncbi:hypothetical protein STSP_38140 [Streptomyces jeddahensis]|uniref:Transposase IS4-like domain-containing protein n=1 Tax=Streptomyces jeddahensis TaxID=1716141 RepID=A0A177HQR1_9ACTN|nr:hypothetical protein STSP_38140 [Streptomyces jeddahensis]
MDRGKPGSKMHVLSDANGLPLVVGISAANTHDSEALARDLAKSRITYCCGTLEPSASHGVIRRASVSMLSS